MSCRIGFTDRRMTDVVVEHRSRIPTRSRDGARRLVTGPGSRIVAPSAIKRREVYSASQTKSELLPTAELGTLIVPIFVAYTNDLDICCLGRCIHLAVRGMTTSIGKI